MAVRIKKRNFGESKILNDAMKLKNAKKGLIFLSLILGTTFQCLSSTPVWLEVDSDAAIKSRILSDFSITWDDGIKLFNERYGISEAELKDWESKHYIETKTIDGVKRIHRKSLGNAKLLNPALNGGWKYRGDSASDARIAYVDSVLAYYDGKLKDGNAHRVHYKFIIDVPYDDALENDTLRVWMPLPFKSDRQSEVKILSTSQPDYVLSDDNSIHSSIYFSKPVVKGENSHFEYEGEFVTRGQYFSPESILANIKPYNKESEEYKKYTSFEKPHIVDMTDLARGIVGDETNPYRQSELVYDYIIQKYPWAGAREYSTIECIPEYVIEEGHGDCGQVSLLYISLMRSLGVPARWESGWMLHPKEKNLHDWAEVYFEGIGWVPVDVSFGRYVHAKDERARKFYSTGMDSHRFATNHGVCGEFYPAKKFVRSETVDAQLGEVETTKGNLFYPAWDQTLQLIEVVPVSETKTEISTVSYVKDKAGEIKKTYAPDKRQDIYEVSVYEGPDSKPVIVGKTSNRDAWNALQATFNDGNGVSNLVVLLPDTNWAQPRISVACLRVGPSHAAEMATQAIMGQPVRVLEYDADGWYRVQTPDGYIGWTTSSSVVPKTDAEMKAWRNADRVIVTSPYQARVWQNEKTTNVREVVSDVVNGNILEGKYNAKKKRMEVTLPDGRKGWIDTSDVQPIEKWAAQDFNSDVILDMAYSMEGTPYLWGGTSAKTLDCSGLAKVSYFANGIILMRDASQQALTGKRIEAEDWPVCEAGDLLFFGNADTGKVTHVAIYDSEGDYVHSSGRVKRNSVDPNSDMYLTTPFLHAVRINGYEGTPGITYARNHPWYFEQGEAK